MLVLKSKTVTMYFSVLISLSVLLIVKTKTKKPTQYACPWLSDFFFNLLYSSTAFSTLISFTS